MHGISADGVVKGLALPIKLAFPLLPLFLLFLLHAPDHQSQWPSLANKAEKPLLGIHVGCVLEQSPSHHLQLDRQFANQVVANVGIVHLRLYRRPAGLGLSNANGPKSDTASKIRQNPYV
jgi:hypothetical protein